MSNSTGHAWPYGPERRKDIIEKEPFYFLKVFLWGRRQFSAFAEFSILFFFSLLWPRAFCRECLWNYSRRSHFHGSLCSSQFVVASTILPGMYIKGAGYFLGRFSYRPSWHLTIGSRYYRCLKWNLSPKIKKEGGNHYVFHGPVFFASFIICMAWFTISFLEEEKISRKKGAFSPSSRC